MDAVDRRRTTAGAGTGRPGDRGAGLADGAGAGEGAGAGASRAGDRGARLADCTAVDGCATSRILEGVMLSEGRREGWA